MLFRALGAANGSFELNRGLEEIHSPAGEQIELDRSLVQYAIAAEQRDLGGSGIELGLEEVRIADANSVFRLEMNEGEVAKDDQAIATSLGRAHECEFERLEDIAERQVKVDRLDRSDHVRLAICSGEPAVAYGGEFPLLLVGARFRRRRFAAA